MLGNGVAVQKTDVPGNVLTSETSFLMGSIARDIIRSIISEPQQRQVLMSAEAAYFKTFDDQSDEELPPEMEEIYGRVRLGHVARIALAAYGEQNDVLLMTSSIFVQQNKRRSPHEVRDHAQYSKIERQYLVAHFRRS